MNRKIWMVLLALFLLVTGLLAITNIRFELQHVLVGVLAIGAAVFLFLDK